MTDRFFIDTNVLVYANDASNPEKKGRAREILGEALSSRRACLSTQVLQEFFVAATRKLGVEPRNARAQVARLSSLEIVLIDTDLVLGAIDLHVLHRLSFWDSLIINAAAAARCTVLYTEDLNAGQVLNGVKVVNPFA